MSVHRLSLVDGVVKLAILYIYMRRIGYDSATANIFFSQSSSSLFALNFKKPSRDKIINKLAWREQECFSLYRGSVYRFGFFMIS